MLAPAGRPEIIVADRQVLFVAALENLLSAPPLNGVVRSVRNTDQLLAEIAAGARVDLVICDLDCGPHTATQLAAELSARQPRVPLVLLSDPDSDHHLIEELGSGADGFFSKRDAVAELLQGVQAVLAGNMAMGYSVMSGVIAMIENHRALPAAPRAELLSATELGILVQLAAAVPVADIAGARGISQKTVRNHLGVIYRKLNVRNRTEAMLYALRLNLGHQPGKPSLG